MLLGIADEAALGSTALAALTALFAYLTGRDKLKFSEERIQLLSKVDSLEEKLTASAYDREEIKERLNEAEQSNEECRKDRHQLRGTIAALEYKLESALIREKERHPEVTDSSLHPTPPSLAFDNSEAATTPTPDTTNQKS